MASQRKSDNNNQNPNVDPLECPICREPFEFERKEAPSDQKQTPSNHIPRVMSACSHTFCTSCLIRQAQLDADKKYVSLCCALCRKTSFIMVPLPKPQVANRKQPVENPNANEEIKSDPDNVKVLKSIESLHKNTVLMDMVSAECARIGTYTIIKEEIKCQECEQRPAVLFCENCTVNFCKSCSDIIHKKANQWHSRDHTPRRLVMVANEKGVLSPQTSSTCKDHNQPCVMYCETDDQVMCSICAVQTHNGHSSTTANEAAIRLRNKTEEKQKQYQVSQMFQ